MPSEIDAIHLDEMLDAATRLASHLRGASMQTFADETLVYDAVCMCLLRIGEGARLLSDRVKAQLPDVPWPDVINLRHRIAHGYSHLRTQVIWMTATESVPPFIEQLTDLRRGLGPG